MLPAAKFRGIVLHDICVHVLVGVKLHAHVELLLNVASNKVRRRVIIKLLKINRNYHYLVENGKREKGMFYLILIFSNEMKVLIFMFT